MIHTLSETHSADVIWFLTDIHGQTLPVMYEGVFREAYCTIHTYCPLWREHFVTDVLSHLGTHRLGIDS